MQVGSNDYPFILLLSSYPKLTVLQIRSWAHYGWVFSSVSHKGGVMVLARLGSQTEKLKVHHFQVYLIASIGLLSLFVYYLLVGAAFLLPEIPTFFDMGSSPSSSLQPCVSWLSLHLTVLHGLHCVFHFTSEDEGEAQRGQGDPVRNSRLGVDLQASASCLIAILQYHAGEAAFFSSHHSTSLSLTVS